MSGISLPKLVSRLPQTLTLEEVERLLDAPRGSRFKNVRNKAMLECSLRHRPSGERDLVATVE
jgi:site-specific recombinase XerD